MRADSKTIELMDAIPALTETPKATVVLQRVPQFKTLTFHKDGFFQAAEFGVTNLALGQFGTGIIAVMAKVRSKGVHRVRAHARCMFVGRKLCVFVLNWN